VNPLRRRAKKSAKAMEPHGSTESTGAQEGSDALRTYELVALAHLREAVEETMRNDLKAAADELGKALALYEQCPPDKPRNKTGSVR
jgi:hypothetical protein